MQTRFQHQGAVIMCEGTIFASNKSNEVMDTPALPKRSREAADAKAGKRFHNRSRNPIVTVIKSQGLERRVVLALVPLQAI